MGCLKNGTLSVAAVIPAYKVKKHVLRVISAIGPEVNVIYVVDDCCPEGTGRFVQSACGDERVCVLFHEKNRGVGGATITGYRQALEDGADNMVKIDGDGQMDPTLVPRFIRPIIEGGADYTKGNRFYYLEGLPKMPLLRIVGNAVLSLISKLSSGYWDIFDPTNGYTAIHARVVEKLPLDKIDKRYFFESDMLFRLNTLRAVVLDIPMSACYGDEVSNLQISRVIPEFTRKHMVNIFKRIFYNYYLRDFSVASIEILLGIVSLLFGVFFGCDMWANSLKTGVPATSGTVMLAALPTLVGIQLILAFLSADVENVPRIPLQRRL